MMQLEFTLLEHRWATITIAGDNDQSLTTEVSYLGDPLLELALACRGLLRGVPETTCALQQEPGEHRITFTRDAAEVDAIVVNVWRSQGNFDTRLRGDVVLTTRCTRRQRATQCINCLRSVRDQFGEAEYQRRTGRDRFPAAELQDLIDLRKRLS